MNFLLRTMAWQTLLEKNGVINTFLTMLHLPNIAIINTPAAIILAWSTTSCRLWYCRSTIPCEDR